MSSALIRWTPKGVPVFGIAGRSGGGKTTLLEALIPRLTARGLRVGVLKHTGHGLAVDHSGKDTDRLYRAGAEAVEALDGEQWFSRKRLYDPLDVGAALARTPQALDLLLIEGFRTGPFEKLWVGDAPDPDDIPGIIGRVPGSESTDEAEGLVTEWLDRTWAERPWGVVVGEDQAEIILGEDRERAICLPLAPDAQRDVAPVVTAMRWLPGHAWVWLRGEHEGSDCAVAEVLRARRPGVWRIEQPALLFEPQMAEELGTT